MRSIFCTINVCAECVGTYCVNSAFRRLNNTKSVDLICTMNIVARLKYPQNSYVIMSILLDSLVICQIISDVQTNSSNVVYK